ncbi:MAG: hypothetical protein IH991_10310 [Planctomycetes bacterium]|nr:hypothetical protein [Planctomycetota bacterium]
MNQADCDDELAEIAVVGDLNDVEVDLTEKLLAVPEGGKCTLFFDSPGGSPYTAISLMSLILFRRLDATGIVTGECSSSALWPFAACRKRIVTAYSVLLFHPLKAQSEEQVGQAEAAEWSRHFSQFERDMDQLLALLLKADESQLAEWMVPGRYVTGRELAEAGFAELVDLTSLI